MCFDDLHGCSNLSSSDDRPRAEIVDAELDVRLLNEIVAENEDIHADDSELLTRLDSADTVVSGMEAKLDEILGTLDDLLTHLEPIADGDKSEGVTIPCSESQSEHPPEEQS